MPTSDWTLLGRETGLPVALPRNAAAAAAVVKRAIPRLVREERFVALRDRVGADLARDGMALLRGVPVADDGVLTAVACAAGMPAARGNGRYPALIHEVVPSANGEFSGTARPVALHTDSWWMTEPHRVLVLACQSSDSSRGGESLVGRVRDLVAPLAADVLGALHDPVFPFPVSMPDGQPSVRRCPILTGDGDATAIRYRRDLIAIGVARSGSPLSATHRKALAALRSVLSDARSPVARLSLQPGDVLFIDNRRCLHGRTALAPDGGRHLRRMKLNEPLAPAPLPANANALPETGGDCRR